MAISKTKKTVKLTKNEANELQLLTGLGVEYEKKLFAIKNAKARLSASIAQRLKVRNLGSYAFDMETLIGTYQTNAQKRASIGGTPPTSGARSKPTRKSVRRK